MNKLLRKCTSCGSYTLESKCPKCGSSEVISPHPPRFSPDDRYLRYRMRERYIGNSQRVPTPSKRDETKSMS